MVNIRQSDIAKELKISRVTVSKALQGHPDISVAMTKKIIATAEKMGYVPNLIARQLNSRRTFTIGIVVPDLENSFFSFIVDSMIDFATEQGYHVILTVSREKEKIERQNIENLIGMRVDGLLVCLSQETTDTHIFRQVEKMKIPLIFFDRTFGTGGFPEVVFDDKAGASEAMRKIIAEGYTRICHFAGYSDTCIGRLRAEGFREALGEYGIEASSGWIIEGGFEVRDGYESFLKLKETGILPEIIFAVNDRVAMGACKAARESGLNIPADIGIFGFGFAEITDFFDPQITIINQDPRKMGTAAMRLLIDSIMKTSGKREKKIVLGEEFLWRNSIKRKKN
jgi:LacI family transcriptional regulator